MLGYYLAGLDPSEVEIAVARVPAEALDKLLPRDQRIFTLPSNQYFSAGGLLRQVQAIRKLREKFSFDLLLGWTARDWELTAAASIATRRPGIGLLHDHPRAGHISRARRCLMQLSAWTGLHRILCVSEAVAMACRNSGYPPNRLHVIRNGIPMEKSPPAPQPSARLRLGFLGVFSERKGLRTLFSLLDALADLNPPEWELALAGGAQDPASERLVADLKARYSSRPWWSRIHWVGWVRQAAEFIPRLDLLIVPSSEFDPFPTVLLEAGAAARPAFANRIGGVPEILVDNVTGWIFDGEQISAGARKLREALSNPARLRDAGAAAAQHTRAHFSVERMAADYAGFYRDILDRTSGSSHRGQRED